MRQCRIMISEGEKHVMWAPNCPAYCMESFQPCAREGDTRVNLEVFLSWQPRGSKPQPLEKSSREKSPEDLLESYTKWWSVHAYEGPTWCQGKSLLREAERKCLTILTRLCSHKSEQKTSGFNVLIALSVQKGISSVVGEKNQWLPWSHKLTYIHI